MKALPLVVLAALVLVSSGGSASDFTLRPVSSTATTVTFTWKRQPGADGYAFLRNGVVIARTLNRSQTTATFWKGTRYAVDVLHVGAGGHVTRGARAVFTVPRTKKPRGKKRSITTKRPAGGLVFVPAPSPVFMLRLVGRTAKTVTFAWKPQPGADGFRFLRNGTVVARTLNRSVTTTTFWKGSRYAVDVLRLTRGKRAIPFRRAKVFVKSVPVRKHTTRSRLVFVPARKIDFRLRFAGRTRRTVTFAWKRQPAADGYRFIRNGKVVSQTFNRAVTRVTFWKGRKYAVEALRRTPGKRPIALMRALAYTASSVPAKTGTGKQKPAAPKSPSPGATKPRTKQPVSSPKTSTSPAGSTSPATPAQPKGPTASEGSTSSSGSAPPTGSTPAGCAEGGYPGAACTGVPSGTALSAYSGPSTISTPNTVIDGKLIRGDISVSAGGVVIRNSKIVGGSIYVDDRHWPGGTPVLIEDTEIDQQNTNTTCVGEAHVIVRRANIHGCENGFDINQDVLIEDSYIHDLYNGGAAHMDGIQLASGHWNGGSYSCCALNVTIRHNTIYGVDPDGSLGTSAIISNSGGDTNILIENNLMAGGAYTLYCEQGTKGINYQVRNNRFSTRFSPKVGAYGPSTECSDETQSGNNYYETGQPLKLG